MEPRPDPIARLTERQAAVLRLAAEGLTNREIAARLGIGLGSVQTHVQRILDKLGASNRAQASAIWARSESRGW